MQLNCLKITPQTRQQLVDILLKQKEGRVHFGRAKVRGKTISPNATHKNIRRNFKVQIPNVICLIIFMPAKLSPISTNTHFQLF